MKIQGYIGFVLSKVSIVNIFLGPWWFIINDSECNLVLFADFKEGLSMTRKAIITFMNSKLNIRLENREIFTFHYEGHSTSFEPGVVASI